MSEELKEKIKAKVKQGGQTGLTAAVAIWCYTSFTTPKDVRAEVKEANAAMRVHVAEKIQESEGRNAKMIMEQFKILHGSINDMKQEQRATNQRVDYIMLS